MDVQTQEGLERLTSRPSALGRFVLVPGVVLMAGMVVLASSGELAAVHRYPGYAFAIGMLLLAVGAWDPVRHRWALRVFAAMTSLTVCYVLYASAQAQLHPVGAVFGFVVLGLPATLFAALGRFRFRSPQAPRSPSAANRKFHWARDRLRPPA